MEYLREITNSNNLLPLFNLPKEMHNRRVEVIILPLEEPSVHGSKSLRGALSSYAKAELQELESEAWANGVKEKYEAD